MAHKKQTILVNLGNAEKKLDDLMTSLFLDISQFSLFILVCYRQPLCPFPLSHFS